MTRLFLLVSFIISFIHLSYAATKFKTRTLGQVIKEVHDIEEKLQNTSVNHTAQWKPSFKTHYALANDTEFAFGVLEPTKKRALAKRRPPGLKIPTPPGKSEPPKGTIRLPKEYNSRDVWGARCPSFNHIMYQGPCGNCWAVALIAMINDRKCMYNPDGKNEFFHSANYLTSCLPKGCGGGWFSSGLDFWIMSGIPGGGDYRMNQPPGCVSYPQNTNTMKNPTCQATCDDGSPITERSYGGARYEIRSMSELEIMAEIFLFGPVIATFDVYDDLAHYYSGGVYRRVSDKKLGGHACKLYGWGEENGVKYWRAANSWGKDWGDGGFFKIQRGVNECNIESNIQAAVPLEAMP